MGISVENRKIPAIILSLMAVLFFLLMACAVFGEGLWRGEIISAGDTDVFLEFYHMRSFMARELSSGNIPLWNPHIFSGVPFLMDPETGIFYPPNWIYLVLPTPTAVNCSVIFHLILLATLTFSWMKQQGHGFMPALMGGTLSMFSGAYFMHIYAGHLGIIATAAWTPLVLLAIDKNSEKWSPGWSLAGIGGVGMSFLAGHLQYVIIAAFSSFLYALYLAVDRRQIRPLYCPFFWYGAGSLLGAAQSFPAIDGLRESYRADLTEAYLASFSFHPESLLTAVAPDFFGDMASIPYWGKEYLWEQSIFVGVFVLFLVWRGILDRAGKILALAVLLLILIALGGHTPLFDITSRHVPFLNKLRGHGKFIFGATILLIPLAVRGAARLRLERPAWLTVTFLGIASIFISAIAYFIGNAFSLEDWRNFIWSLGPGDARFSWYGSPGFFNDAASLLRTQASAAVSLYETAGKMLLLTFLVAVSRYRPQMYHVIVLVAIFDLWFFAGSYAKTFPRERLSFPDLEALQTQDMGSDRIHSAYVPNRAMSYGLYDVNGYNTKISSRRYAAFLTSFLAPANWSLSSGTITGPGRIPDMLRLKYVFAIEHGEIYRYEVSGIPLPRLLLATEYLVREEKDVFPALADPSLDPSRTVILEKEPSVHPSSVTSADLARVLEEDTDHLVIEAELASPKILLITDGYSRHWHVKPIAGKGQADYEVMVANAVFRAIPLRAGYHKFILEFEPFSFAVGKWIALSAWIILVIGVLLLIFRSRVHRR